MDGVETRGMLVGGVTSARAEDSSLERSILGDTGKVEMEHSVVSTPRAAREQTGVSLSGDRPNSHSALPLELTCFISLTATLSFFDFLSLRRFFT